MWNKFTPFSSETYVLKHDVILCSKSQNGRVLRPHIYAQTHSLPWHHLSDIAELKAAPESKGQKSEFSSGFIPGPQVMAWLGRSLLLQAFPVGEMMGQVASLSKPRTWWEGSFAGLWGQVTWKLSCVSSGSWSVWSQCLHRNSKKKQHAVHLFVLMI